ncbi:MAG: DUF1501 domain-containing protein [Planctomycetaceae bacterium]|nr:DUF1501 domain-containing protein [Planctomycetaceae bacterium]
MHRTIQNWFSRVTRREALQIGLGLGVSCLLPSLDLRAADKRGNERPKSLIVLWMAGGQSQLDSWDPHPESKYGGPVKAIDTTVSGLQIADTYPHMADQMQHLSVIRSMVSKEGDHERGTYYVQTGYRPDPTVIHPAMSAVVASRLHNPAVEIPQHIALATGEGFVVPRGGYLGNQLDAFRVFDPGNNLQNLNKQVDDQRQERRLEGLKVLSDSFRKGREFRVADTLHEHVVGQALTMMNSEQLNALKLDDEPKEVIERYGDSRFGRGCLVARRLVETGVRAIQVTLNGFDTHVNNHEGQAELAKTLDPAFAALVQDLVERDLWDSTVVLCLTEFGRTPMIVLNEGRNHWPIGFSCVVGGGGFRSGVVVGETDPDAGAAEDNVALTKRTPPKDPVTVPDLYATILTQLGLDYQEEIITPIGRPLVLAEGTPISQLLPG